MIHTRYKVKRSFFGKETIILQVSYDRNEWKNATNEDLTALSNQDIKNMNKSFSDKNFTVGTRVKIKYDAHFSKGMLGHVEFQEPSGGKVWVLRDYASTPCWFYADELEVVS